MGWLFGSFYGDFSDPVFMSDDYRNWAKGRHPASNAMVYFDMVKERNYATRLEF